MTADRIEHRGDVVTIWQDGIATHYKRVRPVALPLLVRVKQVVEWIHCAKWQRRPNPTARKVKRTWT